jgi:hypothetical protein
MDGVTVAAEYSAPAAICPAEADFWQAFSSRAQHAVRGEPAEWRLVVRIERARNRFSGSVLVTHGKAEALSRSLEDDSCADLATALAVIAAITVESAPRTPKPPPPPEDDFVVDLPPPVLPPERVNLRVGVGTEGTSFLAPVASAGIAAFFEAEAPKGFFAPRIRVGPHFSTSFPFRVESATAIASSFFARVEVGGLRIRFARVFALRAGAFVDIGAIVVEGRDAPHPQTVTAPFFVGGAILRLAWETPIFFLEVGGGVAFPFTRSRFFFRVPDDPRPPNLAFEFPGVGAMGEVGVGVRFF